MLSHPQVSEHEKGLTVAINENGEIMKTAAGNVTNMEVEQTQSNSDASKEIICRLCKYYSVLKEIRPKIGLCTLWIGKEE